MSDIIIILEDDENRIKKFRELFPSSLIVNSANECINLLMTEKEISLLMLDHDLGGEIYVDTDYFNTGSEVVRWIERNKPEIKEIVVHSYNSSVSLMMMNALLKSGYNAQRIPFNYDWEVKNEERN